MYTYPKPGRAACFCTEELMTELWTVKKEKKAASWVCRFNNKSEGDSDNKNKKQGERGKNKFNDTEKKMKTN